VTGGLEMAYTDFLQLVQARQSDRSYDKERPVEPEKLERVLEAARLAPSACNAQPWRFVVITDKELAQKAGKAAAGLGMNKFAKDAPVHILVVEESANITSLLGGKVKGKHFPLIDIGIAVTDELQIQIRITFCTFIFVSFFILFFKLSQISDSR
jgi:nitroreductase